MWVVYFGVILALAAVLVTSIVRHLRGPPRRPPPTGALPTRAALRVCVGDLELLYREQNERAWALGKGFEARDALSTWGTWARAWEERVDDLTDRCRLDVTTPGEEGLAERVELAAARDALLALHRAYAAQVNRFAEEQRELARAAAESLAHARDAVSAGR